jgi:hypothetical protein
MQTARLRRRNDSRVVPVGPIQHLPFERKPKTPVTHMIRMMTPAVTPADR